MQALTFNIRLLEPLLAASPQGDPNSGTSYPFIPGSLIRGALINQYLNGPDPISRDKLATDETTRRLFFNGQTRYLNAYLLDRNQRRTLPGALSWYKEKASRQQYTAYDKAHPDFTEEDHFAEVEQPKPIESQFCRFDGETIEFYDIRRLINVHTQRERRAGRATETEGAIFRYESLAPGQTFGAVILFDQADDLTRIKSLLPQALFLGGSRQAGYGQVSIENLQEKPRWQETEIEPDEIVSGQLFTITFTSDALFRDKHGHYLDELNSESLAQALGLEPDKLEGIASFKLSGRVSGFNRKWGTPLPQATAIRAGSVFTFKSQEAISKEAIERLVDTGLGERRAEGFGRVACNWLAATPEIEAMTWTLKESLEKPASLNGTSQALAKQMVERLLRRDADRSLGQTINEIIVERPPKRSQLGGLRVIIRGALADRNLQPILDYLDNMREVSRRQFEAARVRRGGGKDGLIPWLRRCLQQPGEIWDKIGFDPTHQAIHLGSIRAEQDEKLHVEYTLRLIDGVLAKTTKMEGENR